jgi:hypothetical protein
MRVPTLALSLLTVGVCSCGAAARVSGVRSLPTSAVPTSSLASTEPVTKPASVGPPRPAPEAWTIGDALDRALTAQAQEYYGGLELGSGDAIVIHVLDAGRSQVEAIVQSILATYPTTSLPPNVVRSGPPPQQTSIMYVTATATFASLMARVALLTHSFDVLRAEGITLTDWGPNVTTNSLDVGVTQTLTPSITAKIEAVVGPNNLHLSGNQTPASA